MPLMPRQLLSLLLASAWLLAGGNASAQSPLADLIQNGADKAALELLQSGANVNAAQADGSTPLLWAVYSVNEELVAALLRREADPDIANNFGASPLSEAARLANLPLVEMLLDAGAEPDRANADGQTPLMLAAYNGSVDIAKALVANGADVNAVEQWTGQSALMWAAARNHGELAAFLIAAGADVQRRSTHFDWSSQLTSEPRGQYRPAGGLTPLLFAARSGCIDCARALLQAGADANLPTPEGVTPLIVAIENFNFDIANLLLDSGASPHAFDWWVAHRCTWRSTCVRSKRAANGSMTPARPRRWHWQSACSTPAPSLTRR